MLIVGLILAVVVIVAIALLISAPTQGAHTMKSATAYDPLDGSLLTDPVELRMNIGSRTVRVHVNRRNAERYIESGPRAFPRLRNRSSATSGKFYVYGDNDVFGLEDLLLWHEILFGDDREAGYDALCSGWEAQEQFCYDAVTGTALDESGVVDVTTEARENLGASKPPQAFSEPEPQVSEPDSHVSDGGYGSGGGSDFSDSGGDSGD